MKFLENYSEHNKNKMKVYSCSNQTYQTYAIMEQGINGVKRYITLFDQGDNSDDFWFTEDSSEHPTIDLDNWFDSWESAKSYLEDYCKGNLEFCYDTTTDLKWE